MKTNLTSKNISALITSLVASAVPLSATVVVDFGPSQTIVTASINVQPVNTGGTSGTQTTHTNTRAYDISNAWMSNTVNSGYDVAEPAFFGGIYTTMTNSVAFTQGGASLLMRNDAGTDDRIRSQTMGGAAATMTSFTQNYAVLFSTGGNYAFDSTSTLNWDVNTGTVNSSNRSMRYVVVAGGNTYVSETTQSPTATRATLTLDNPDAINWAQWTVGADLSFSGLTYSIAGTALTNITMAGYAINSSSSAGAQTIVTINTYGFNADLASAVPEPSSYAALVGLGAVGFAAVRRRRRA